MEPNTETKTHAKPAKIPRIGHPARDDCRQADCTQCPQMPASGEQKKRKNSADNAAAECRCAGRRRRMKPVLADFRPAVNAAACAAFASRRPSAFAAMPRCHASRSASPLPCPPPTPLRRASCRQGCTHCGHAWRFSPGGARDSSRAGSSSRVIWGQDEGDRRGLRSKTRRGTLCVQPEDTATAESSDDAQHHPPDFRRSCSYRRV